MNNDKIKMKDIMYNRENNKVVMTKENHHKLMCFIHEKDKQIKRLKSNEKTLADLLDKEQKKNRKAIEYIRTKSMIVKVGNDFNIDLYLKGSEYNELLNILLGEDKE